MSETAQFTLIFVANGPHA